MSKDRDEILADFQACTGMEDVTRAISILEENNWDLVRSVNEVMPQESQSFHSHSMHDVEMVSEVIDIPASPVESATDMLSVGNNVGHARARSMPTLEDGFNNSVHQPSTSASVTRQNTVQFNVQFGDRIINIDIPDTGTIADIKARLYRELKIPPCQQLLSGWARHDQFEHVPVKSLMAPNQNALSLTVKPTNGGILADQDNNITERLKGTYVLKIKNLSEANKEYHVNYPGTKTILEVKNDVYTFTNIHVRNQIWTGWPPNIDDQSMLALSGINYPEHELTVRQNILINHTRDKRPSSTNVVQIDSDDEEYEDASESFNVDDDIFVDNVTTKRVEPLIPEMIEDEIVGSISFVERFSTRYGAIHPQFYQGTLEDALKEACQRPAKDKKILGIYLHHDSSVLSNVFCTQLLGVESVMQVIERNFVFWGWDLTFESNRTRLQNSVSNCMGATAAMSLRDIPVDKLPAIIIIMKVRSSTDIYSVIYGNVGINELLSSLIEAVDVFTDQQRVEVKEEQERAERELVKWEQDMAYRESLEADRAKEEAKRLIAEAEAKEKLRVETERSEKLAQKEAYRREVEASLPPEPSAEQGDSITQIRFRLPNGKNLERRFLANTQLKVLLDYLTVQGYPNNEYKVISSWPRRDLTTLDNTKTLQDLKLCPKETVILEER
ncbi:FAS-associated factor 1 [Onthophagus taurus]|uniref:FAS-associated factor 1 n=1 Tax=Onthophagus taurus TaxID=166361 RepID=UPI000C20752F|nr:FAS-associated factor 1-like [Onthophagus taurus]